jgi:hypothetical protein
LSKRVGSGYGAPKRVGSGYGALSSSTVPDVSGASLLTTLLLGIGTLRNPEVHDSALNALPLMSAAKFATQKRTLPLSVQKEVSSFGI